MLAQPDYILIQFGHNDGPSKGPDRETDPKTTFRENMTRNIEEARAAGAQPILVTSIVRRAFTEDGKIKRDSLVPYVEAVRDLAAVQKVPLIDLYTLTLVEAEKVGSEGCAEIDARLPDGKRDRTHLGPKGRQEVGRMAAEEFVKLMPAMAVHFGLGRGTRADSIEIEWPSGLRQSLANVPAGSYLTVRERQP